MNKLYQKSELFFALVWIGLYVVVMNIALQFCGGFDDLSSKTVSQVLVPVICIIALAAASALVSCATCLSTAAVPLLWNRGVSTIWS